MTRQLRFILVCILMSNGAFAQTTSSFTVRHYSMSDGLAHNRTKSIVQDKKGRIWLGTWNGVDKFDGYTFRNFKSYPTDKVKLNNNRIEGLRLTADGNLWVESYGNQAFLFNTKAEIFENVFEEKQHPLVSDIKCLGNGITWMISQNNELYRIDDRRYTQPGGIQFFGPGSNPYFGDTIHDIFLDSGGDEWILTNKGILIEGAKKISNNKPCDFIAEAGGVIYLASRSGYLATYSEGRLVPFQLPFAFTQINRLKRISDHQIAVICPNQVVIFSVSNGKTRRVSLPSHTEFVSSEKVFYDSHGYLWAFASNNQVVCYNSNTDERRILDYPDFSGFPSTSSDVSFFHEDGYGEIWMLLDNGILCTYNRDKKRLEIAYYNDSSGDQTYYKAAARGYLRDTHKNLWISARDGFEYLSFRKKIHEYIMSPANAKITDAHQEEVRGLFQDKKKRLWLGQRNGKVTLYDAAYNYIGNLDSTGQIVNDRKAVFGAAIYCFLEDDDGSIWLGTREAGLFVLRQKNALTYDITQYQPDSTPFSINSDAIFSMLKDSQQRIWIGCYGGGLNLVEKKDDGTLRFLHAGNRLQNYPINQCEKIRHVFESEHGTILVGTTNGLISFSSAFNAPEDITFFHNFSTTDRTDCLSNNEVLNIFQDKNENIYVSTFSGGIDITSDSPDLLSGDVRFRNINKTNGLASDLSLSVIEDKEGFIWIASVNAFSRLEPESGHIDHFNKATLNLPLVITDAAPITDYTGNLIFGTVRGALRMLIDPIAKSTFVPPIVFTDISTQSQDVQHKHNVLGIETLSLGKNERNLTISFASLDYASSGSIKYAYRLKDTDSGWVYIDKNRSASFINLAAGHHVFQVKSTNGDGVWVDNVTSLPIYVTPTFWETGFAWIIYIIGFVFLVLLVMLIITYILNLRKQVDFEQELTRLKLRFFTDISHELRTPLTLIASPIDEILNSEPLSPHGKQHMAIAKQNTDRMLQLINQILDFRKIQDHKMKVYLEQTDVLSLIEETFNSFSVIAEQKQINYTLEMPEKSCEIYTDSDKVGKILFNLLSNAFKYTPNGRRITLFSKIEKDKLFIQVTDEGRGFDIRHAGHLFERFETSNGANPSTSSGIGLSLVNELVNLLHGSIDVDSNKGIGSTFSVCLPIKYEAFADDRNVEFILDDSVQDATDTAVYAAGPEEKEPRILIIEDNDELRHFIKSILGKEYHVFEAVNGKEGLEMTIKEAPDIIVSDIMMPEMDGVAYLNAVKSNRDISHIPVILLTAKSSIDDQIEGMEFGADDYIIKPFNSTYLKAKIAALIKQRRQLRDYYLSNTPVQIQKQPADKWEPSAPKITHHDDEFMCKVVKDIEDNIENVDFRIDDLAAAMNMSRPVFYRKIKAIVGLSPIDFVKKMRIRRAAQLLETGQFSVAEVAYQSGFTTPQYLSKVFKEVKGYTPTEYLKLQKKESSRFATSSIR